MRKRKLNLLKDLRAVQTQDDSHKQLQSKYNLLNFKLGSLYHNNKQYQLSIFHPKMTSETASKL